MPLNLTTAERRRVAMIRKRLADVEEGRQLTEQLFGRILEKSPALKQAMEGVTGDQNNLRWLLAILDREDAR